MRALRSALCFATLALVACGGSSLDVEGRWQLVSFGTADNQTPANPVRGAILEFGDDGMVTGHTGCNTFGGECEVDGDRVDFDVFLALVACPTLREQEDAIVGVLTSPAEAGRDRDLLELRAGDPEVVVIWERVNLQ